MTRKKYVYVAHPYRNNPEENLKKVTEICRELHKKDPTVIPISPIHLFSWMDPDTDVIDSCYDLMDFCGGKVSFHGDWMHSEGCILEAEYHWDKAEERFDLWAKRVMWVFVIATIFYCLGMLQW